MLTIAMVSNCFWALAVVGEGMKMGMDGKRTGGSGREQFGSAWKGFALRRRRGYSGRWRGARFAEDEGIQVVGEGHSEGIRGAFQGHSGPKKGIQEYGIT